MAAYLTVAQFKVRTIMLGEHVDALEARYPGFLDAKLGEESAWLNARLFKRYAVPFKDPTPETVLRWLVAIVTLWAFKKRGFDAIAPEGLQLQKDSDDARAEAKEAADSVDGFFDLPPRQDLEGASGISRGGPLGYSEQSPYTFVDKQAEALEGGSG
jgi:hypothetical protein